MKRVRVAQSPETGFYAGCNDASSRCLQIALKHPLQQAERLTRADLIGPHAQHAPAVERGELKLFPVLGEAVGDAMHHAVDLDRDARAGDAEVEPKTPVGHELELA